MEIEVKKILGDIRLIQLDVKIWSGGEKLTPSDLGLQPGDVPPEALAKLGRKVVFDPRELKLFHACRKEVERAILSVGTRCMKGFAVPTAKFDGLMGKVIPPIERFRSKRDSLIPVFEQICSNWVAENPEWAAMIRNAKPSVACIEKMRFGLQAFSIEPVSVEGIPEAEEGLQKEINGLSGQLRQEIEIQARAVWKQSFQGKAEVTQKALRPIREMVDKIDGLKFLEPALDELVEGIMSVLGSLPKKGILKGQHLARVCGILSLLGNIPEADSTTEGQEVAEEDESSDSPTPAAIVNNHNQDSYPAEWF
jgi:hypothetical protein